MRMSLQSTFCRLLEELSKYISDHTPFPCFFFDYSSSPYTYQLDPTFPFIANVCGQLFIKNVPLSVPTHPCKMTLQLLKDGVHFPILWMNLGVSVTCFGKWSTEEVPWWQSESRFAWLKPLSLPCDQIEARLLEDERHIDQSWSNLVVPPEPWRYENVWLVSAKPTPWSLRVSVESWGSPA